MVTPLQFGKGEEGKNPWHSLYEVQLDSYQGLVSKAET